jgi:pyruvate formate lyase activating enzyme
MEADNVLMARIFDVEFFGTKDGPGIRTVIFFKGCNLHCGWCHNPESQEEVPQLLYYVNKCVKCGRCLAACPAKAIRKDEALGFVVDQNRCTRCGTCVALCTFNARKLVGERMDLERVKGIVEKDREFFEASTGGVTLSGGEPLLQREFLKRFLEWLHAERIHTAIETAGNYPVDWLSSLISLIDLVFVDLKHVDAELHRRMTGADNGQVLAVLRYLIKNCPEKTIVRIPVIPGFNDGETSRTQILGFLKEEGWTGPVEILPYHDLGLTKYAALNRECGYTGVASLSPGDVSAWTEVGNRLGLNVRIGAL